MIQLTFRQSGSVSELASYLVCETDHFSVWMIAKVVSSWFDIAQLLLYVAPLVMVGVFAGVLIVR